MIHNETAYNCSLRFVVSGMTRNICNKEIYIWYAWTKSDDFIELTC